ncbi:MAG: SMC-Scp complex subunit ScpB, partial [Ruminococcaceae bacterium]|nr:SMC-Scp complex subunit ScpB [Oscillospiraceae bacterium]
IEQVRGVDSTYAVTTLCEKQLVEVVGRLDVPGKPNLYATTETFLRCFGLSSLDELPKTEVLESTSEGEAEEKTENTENTENTVNA